MDRGPDDYKAPEIGALADPRRLSVLDELELLDTAAEETFDRITRLASLCLDVPVSLISLVDHDRQFFKSAVGLPDDLTGTPIAGSFCRHAVESREPLIVNDARAHPLVRDNPSVEDLGVIAYAGAPLITDEGFALGTLCAIDSCPREWSERQVTILTGFAELATSEITLRGLRLRQEALEHRLGEGASRLQVVSDELIASRLQRDRSREETVQRMARAVEARSEETGAHIERMSRLCERLAQAVGLCADRCSLIRHASMLHDVGKIAVPDAILKKPGALTAEERRVIEEHALTGYHMLAGSDEPILEVAAMIALTHHERLDGAGYPSGLIGEQIPLEGRIAAVADVYDALTSDRVYRSALGPGEALDLMRRDRGTHFDARLLDALTAHVELELARVEAAAARTEKPLVSA